jgi:methylglyoxal synthase
VAGRLRGGPGCGLAVAPRGRSLMVPTNPMMTYKTIAMNPRKRIALVAHDGQKQNLVEWAAYNRGTLGAHEIWATGTTGAMMEDVLGLPVHKLFSGPLGGDQQIGAMIVEGKIDCLIFFWDPLEPQPHDPDVKALLRMAVVWNIPTACDRATADFLISSPLLKSAYERRVPDYEAYRRKRLVAGAKPAARRAKAPGS